MKKGILVLCMASIFLVLSCEKDKIQEPSGSEKILDSPTIEFRMDLENSIDHDTISPGGWNSVYYIADLVVKQEEGDLKSFKILMNDEIYESIEPVGAGSSGTNVLHDYQLEQPVLQKPVYLNCDDETAVFKFIAENEYGEKTTKTLTIEKGTSIPANSYRMGHIYNQFGVVSSETYTRGWDLVQDEGRDILNGDTEEQMDIIFEMDYINANEIYYSFNSGESNLTDFVEIESDRIFALEQYIDIYEKGTKLTRVENLQQYSQYICKLRGGNEYCKIGINNIIEPIDSLGFSSLSGIDFEYHKFSLE